MTSAAGLSQQVATQTAAAVPTTTATPQPSRTPAATATATATVTATPVTGSSAGGAPQNPAPSVPVIQPGGSAPSNVCVARPTSGTVNVRQGPALSSAVVALLQTYAVVTNRSGDWFQIDYVTSSGWVSGTVVQLSGPCAPYGVPQPQAEVYCHFAPYGVNGANVDLLTQPNGAFLTYADANADFIVTGESGSWVRVLYGVTGHHGWILRERGQVSGNCANLEQVVFGDAPECRITASIPSASFMQPYPGAPFFGAFPTSASVEATVRTADGWYGFDPGVNWVPPDVTGIARLRWLPAGNPLGVGLTTTAGCEQLPMTTYSQPMMVCPLAVSTATDFYTTPGDSVAAGTLPAGANVNILARNMDGWMGFEPDDAQPGNMGLARLRWVADPPGGFSPDCMALPLIAYP